MSIRDRLRSVKIAQALRELQEADSGFQAELVSGTNIKTINGNSLLGSGNLVVSGGATPIYAQARRQAQQTIAATTWTAVSFDTEGADSGSLFSLSNPTYIEVPSNGIYTISAFVPWRTVTTVTSNRGIAICKNAAPSSGNLSGVWHSASGDSTAQSCTWTGTLAAGDKIYLYVYTNGADDIRVNTGYGACFIGVMGFAT
jgi:hypothetical protein